MTQQTNPQPSEELRKKVKQIMEAELSPAEVAQYALGNKSVITDIMIEQTMQLINQEVQKALSMVEVPRKYSTGGYSISGGKGPTLIAHNKAVNQVTASINKIKEQYK